jgi:hypothetical protein
LLALFAFIYLEWLMQIACHRCGAVLDEGTAFCPSCGAPQIRVSPEQATPPMPPGTPGDLQPPAMPVALPAPLDWSVGIKACALMGLVASLPSSVPIVSTLCCLWLLGGAALTVKLYRRWSPVSEITTGQGVRLGAVMGLCTFAFWVVFRIAAEALRGGFRQRMVEQLQRSAATNPDPNVQEVIRKLATPEGIAIFVTLMIVITLFSFVIFGIAGGALGASLWGRRKTS